jgi:hypothetical protein
MKKIDTWISEARSRAQRRRSPWNLLLFPVVAVMVGLVWFNACRFILYLPHSSPVPLREISKGNDLQMIFVIIPLFFPSIAWGMIFANTIMWMLPPARRTFEREAHGHKGCSFFEATSGLLKFALIATVIAVPISLIASYRIRL